ncbi:hypothetical protein K438DRAFT_1817548 [Mycena galopus ATCC 62051]|nr:hypothetical protein K438DRAFT_1817548 [Mycena galopus ATCC 62051]
MILSISSSLFALGAGGTDTLACGTVRACLGAAVVSSVLAATTGPMCTALVGGLFSFAKPSSSLEPSKDNYKSPKASSNSASSSMYSHVVCCGGGRAGTPMIPLKRCSCL